MSKTKFINETLRIAFQVEEINRKTKDLIDVYADRNYGTSDPITDADLTDTEIGIFGPGEPHQILTVAQFNELASLLMGNVDTAARDRELIINKYRIDI